MEKLEKIIESYHSIQLAKKHLKKITMRLGEEESRLARLSVILNKEYEDLSKFQNLSLIGMFNKFLVDQKQQYEIEKQEYLLAALKYNESKKVVELLHFEKNLIEEKIRKEADVSIALRKEIARADNLILNKYPEIRTQLDEFNTQITRSIRFRKELREVMIVCLKIEKVFTEMINYLHQAKKYKNWGTYYREIQHGKKEKQSYLDQAQQLSYIARQLLQQLEDELEDIYKFLSASPLKQFEESQHFNDIYYNRLLSDWIINHEINNSLNCIIGNRDGIQRIHITMKSQMAKTEKDIQQLSKARDLFIVNYLK